jgi:glucuronokinase
VVISTEVNARAGLLGNPSDMYGGKVISFIIENFSTRVRIWESPQLAFRLHPQHDRMEFADLADLLSSVRRHGYYGMQRVLFAACCRFAAYCQERGIALRKANFTVDYETNIPRQSGLGGSSAVIIAVLRALMRFYRVPPHVIAPSELADLALSVETQELAIAAGPQDRVVQAYGGLTYMDFSGAHGRYQRLDSPLLPRFGLAHVTEKHLASQESGQVHAPLRRRWDRGDPEVRRAMRAIAHCAELGLEALRQRNVTQLGRLMDRNFDLRRKLFGEGGLERHNTRLVEIARAAAFSAKLPGSGGAALVLLDGGGSEEELAANYQAEGYVYTPIRAK